MNNLACVPLNSTIGLNVRHVPYRSVVQAMTPIVLSRYLRGLLDLS
jgi:hypothetical protein